jgi:hypothetical protein
VTTSAAAPYNALMRLAVPAAALLLAAGLGTAYAAGAFGGDSQPRPGATGVAPPPPDEAQLASIRHLVLHAAAKMGDPSPTDGVVVPTTRRLAELVDVDTSEADIPVYFVLVHGDFKGGRLLTLTIDPSTDRSIDTGVVGAPPAVDAIGAPEPLSLSPGRDLTMGVPCLSAHQHLVGPKTVRRFHAVTAVSCVEGTRTYPGEGQWWVRIRRVAVGNVAGLQRYFGQPNGPKLKEGDVCLLVARLIAVPTFVDRAGNWLIPRTPVDGCGEPRTGYAHVFHAVRWRVVAVRKVKLMVSAAALAAHCAMGIKDLPAGGIGPLSSTSGGPLFRSTPRTARVCVYRTRDFVSGSFVRGFSLDAAQTHRLLGAMTGAAPSGSCPHESTFAVVSSSAERWVEVELGGCWRVGRTYPDYGTGGSDPAVVRAILARR